MLNQEPTVHAIGDGERTPESACVPFVRDFAAGIAAALLEGARTRVFHKGERIFSAGQTPDRLCIVISGMAELCGTVQSPECGVLLVTEGDLVFPMAALHGEPCLTSVTALTRTRVAMLDSDVVKRVSAAHPQVGTALARVMGAQWRMAVRHIIDLKCRSAAERLAAFLLQFMDHSDEDVAELPFTKSALAARLGVSRETLSRCIQVVAAHGVILRGSQIIVRDRKMALEFCGPEQYSNRSERRLDVNAF